MKEYTSPSQFMADDDLCPIHRLQTLVEKPWLKKVSPDYTYYSRRQETLETASYLLRKFYHADFCARNLYWSLNGKLIFHWRRECQSFCKEVTNLLESLEKEVWKKIPF
jgi:hypothetical protein